MHLNWFTLQKVSERTVARRNLLRVRALRITQLANVPVYTFGIDGRVIHQIAGVSVAERTNDGELRGYQRAPVKKHIEDILAYLSQSESILPNAIVIAFDDRVEFELLKGQTASEWGTFGTLSIPIPSNAVQTKPGWIVDGQQRVAALSKLDPRRGFPVVVVGFQSASQELQREQFLLVNRTKPLPRDLLNEILPGLSTSLPRHLDRQRLAAQVVQRLRYDEDSPFSGRIKGIGTGGEEANISQAAILTVIQNSINKKGVLFDSFKGAGGKHDIKQMVLVLKVFYGGVARTWPEAWAGSPKKSRLVHGVGIVSLGHLMERVLIGIDPHSPQAKATVERRLATIKNRCAWTRGRWPVLGCGWNELQNTSQDKSRLTDYLLNEYSKTRI